MNNQTKYQDFDLEKIVTSDQHTQDIEGLNARITALEKKVGSPIELAATLSECSEHSVKMREMLANTFVGLLDTDNRIKEALTKLINTLDRNWFHAFAKRIGLAAWSAIIFILGIIMTIVIGKFFPGAPPAH